MELASCGVTFAAPLTPVPLSRPECLATASLQPRAAVLRTQMQHEAVGNMGFS